MIGAQRQRGLRAPDDVRAVSERNVTDLRARTAGPASRHDDVAGLQSSTELSVGQNGGRAGWCKDAATKANIRTVRLGSNQYVERIKQQRSHCALWRPRVRRAAVIQKLVARDLDESTVAAPRAAAGEDGPGEGGLAVRPQHDLAAVAAPPSRG